jgi:hypothetical protein
MLVATSAQLFRWSRPAEEPRLLHQATGIRRVVEQNGRCLIALADGGLLVLAHGASHVIRTGITDGIECVLPQSNEPLTALIGTGEGHLYRLAGESAERVAAFDALECRKGWRTPWGGPAAVRSLAATRDGWVYADIHVGSIMRSPDMGATWEPVTPDLNDDVHQVATTAASDERVYANTARGVYVSDDRGASWAHRSNGLAPRYGRAIAVHPDDPDCILATVSAGPHGGDVGGRLFRSEDAGRSWTPIAEGFPSATPHNIDTFHVAFSRDGLGWAIAGRTLYVGRDAGKSWSSFWEAPEPIRMVASG